jgi:hypothetical protein
MGSMNLNITIVVLLFFDVVIVGTFVAATNAFGS